MGNTENNVNYQILRFVKEGYTYIEAALKFYDESAEEDNIVKYAKSLDTSIIKLSEKLLKTEKFAIRIQPILKIFSKIYLHRFKR